MALSLTMIFEKEAGGPMEMYQKTSMSGNKHFGKKPSYTYDIVCLYTVHICTSIKDAGPSTWITHLFHFWVGQWERSYNFKLTRIPKRNLFWSSRHEISSDEQQSKLAHLSTVKQTDEPKGCVTEKKKTQLGAAG